MKRSAAMYDDVRQILDSAIESGGGVVQLTSPGQAVRWRQRAYEFRKLMREKSDWSIYDRITLRKLEPGDSHIVIAVIEQTAIFTPAEGGKPVLSKPSKVKKSRPDNLEEIANIIAGEIDELL